jgi:hypothetical protein
VKSVASGDDVAFDLVSIAVVHESHSRSGRFQLVDTYVGRIEKQRSPGPPPGSDQILDDLVLPIDCDRPAAGERSEVDAVSGSTEPNMDAFVPHTFPAQAITHADGVHQIDRALLEHASAHSLDDVLLAPILDDDRVDPRQMEKMAEHQAGRTRSDDSDLRTSA